ncbi:MAG: tetratricopeptide repeat protein [Tunicatimonas sp.]
MQDHSENDHTLDRYLRDEMSDQERRTFEEQLSTDDALTDELALQRDAIEGIRLDGSHALKRRLQAVEAELAKPDPAVVADKKTNRRFLTTWVAIAASLLTVLLLGYLFVPSASSPQELYAAHYQPFPNLINPAQRSTEVEEATVLERAVRAYDEQQYDQAIKLFEQADALSAPGYIFYYAASYLGLGQPEQAIPLLERVVQEKTDLFYEPGLWHLALAHLQANNPEAARPYLQTLAEREGDYTEEARELLEELP